VLDGLHVEQRFCFAAFGEKSSLAEVMLPWCQTRGVEARGKQ
jgi:hypothetical protein